ncbi:hypothetical protein OPKNFCMD_1361 [Methylobacterium crusticola]|uniref:Phospholipase A2 domain-containing protein n=1 Tax=Methylobacterium crusticola TaxID=1697972 RepID=A0ABQ4QTJ0_9HYPH|nr:hypothetical protein [Methylobacterium crusticola]GJD48638.1 hypothetical protein OPKNFCMD_1361 [Methylobacterium crusticola]
MIIRLAAPALLAALLIGPSQAHAGPSLLLHGNYCGPGNNAPLAPIDALDAACARHDACTPAGGLASRACNARLQRDAEMIARDPRRPDDLRALAGLVSAAASLFPSAPVRHAAMTRDPRRPAAVAPHPRPVRVTRAAAATAGVETAGPAAP